MSDELRIASSKQRKHKPTQILFVSNGGAENSSSGEDDDHNDYSPAHPTSSNLSFDERRPLPQYPPPLTTNLSDNSYYPSSRSNPSNPALSSPSSTSSPAIESTPPPSTPGQSNPPDLSADGTLRQEPSMMTLSYSNEGTSQLAANRGLLARVRSHLPQRQSHGRRLSANRPAISPTISVTESPFSQTGTSRASPSERITFLVTHDTEHLVIVDVSGARDPAFIRERIYSKLQIADDEQYMFSIYRTEIGKCALGEALNDDQLWDLYRERGDERGSIVLLVSPSHAAVHEPSFEAKETSPIANIIPPHVLPQLPSQQVHPLRPRRRSNSRRDSVSSAGERPEALTGYEGSISDDLEQSERDPRRTAQRSPPQPYPPRQPLPPRPRSPSGFGRPQSPGPIVSPDRTRPPASLIPAPRSERTRGSALPTPPSQTHSPDLSRFQEAIPAPNPPYWHARSGSDAPLDSDRVLLESQIDVTSCWRPLRDDGQKEGQKEDRDKLRRRDFQVRKDTTGLKRSKKTYYDTPETESRRRAVADDWTFVPSNGPSSGYRKDRPTTPQDPRPSPSRQGLTTGYPLSIPQHPRVPPPAPPPAPPGGNESRERSKRQAGKPVPPSYVIAYMGPQNPSKDSTVPQSPSGASWTASRLFTKSMGNLREAYKNQTPPTSLQAGRRPPASPLPVSTKLTTTTNGVVSGLNYNSPSSVDVGYHDSTSALDGLPKSYDGSRGPLASPIHYSPRQLGLSTYNSQSSNTYLGPTSAVTGQEPYQRPNSSFGNDPSASPFRSARPLQSPNGNGTEYASAEAVQPRVSPIVSSHYPSSSASSITHRDDGHSLSSFGPRPLPVHPRHERAATESLPITDRPVQLTRVPRTPPRSPISAKTPPLESRDTERNALPEPPQVQRTLSSLPVREDDAPSSAENTVRHDDVVRYRDMLENINSGLGTVVPLKPQPPSAPPRQPSPAASVDLSSSNISEGTYMSSTMSSDDSDRENGTDTYWAVPPKKPQRPVLTPIDTESSPSSSSAALPRDNSRAQPTKYPPLPQYEPKQPMPQFTKFKKGQDQRTSRFDNDFDMTWAPRPPPEEVFERLQEYFPEHDVDEPVIEAASGGTSPTSAEPEPMPQTERRYRHKKSIRVVAAEHKRRVDRTSRMDSSANAGGLRKRNTKLWGSRLEEVTTDHTHGHHEILATSAESSPGPAKPIFRWVRGELIGKGTYGKVYLALNATTGEMIAVKQVEMPRTASDKDDSRQVSVVEALKLESETLKDLDHPNIVQYLGFEETPTFLSIFLEYVPGGSIASCLRKHGKFDEEVTKSFTGQILSGLEYLHSKGILHRDLKADNILVETSGICKISDFGISKRTDDINNPAYTSMQGTVFWMAPEVIDAKQKGYNSKIDIWSVGCVVFEMWTGQRPWSGREAMAVLLQLYQTKQGPPVPKEITLSPLADDFRRKCFATNPDERPSAAELRKHPYLELQPDWTFNGFK